MYYINVNESLRYFSMTVNSTVCLVLGWLGMRKMKVCQLLVVMIFNKEGGPKIDVQKRIDDNCDS